MNRFQFVFGLFLAATVVNFTAPATDVLTNRGTSSRTGLNSTETILNPSNVSSPAFGLLYHDPVDGEVYAQPLYVSQQRITPAGGQPRVANVLYVATEHDSLYAFDADTGAQYWKKSLLLSGESTVSSEDVNSQLIQPEIGVTATPVIDRSAGPNGTLFVVAFSKNGTQLFDRLHAIDLSTGQDRLTPVLISASLGSPSRPANTFNAKFQLSRSALLLLNGLIYTAWASFNDNPPFTGWIIAYNESDLSRALVFNTNPNGSPPSDLLPDGSGDSIWQAGNGPAVDSNGTIYVSTANGPFASAQNDYGDTVLKLTNNQLAVADYFTPFDQANAALHDIDLGSGGPLVLPDLFDANHHVHHLLAAAGKDANLYLLDRDNLGKFHAGDNSQIYQELRGVLTGGVWSSPAYFNTFIYFGGSGDVGNSAPLWQFQFDFTANPNKPILKSSAIHATTTQFGYPGATPTVSSNGNTNGIVWAYENNSRQAVLHAYDATNVGIELFNSGNIGGAVKFVVPTVCNGRVYVGTSSSVAVFGLPSTPGSGVTDDFNNDGKADLLLENTATGKRAIWYLSDGIFQSSSALPTVGPQWHIAGSTDFLGNGQASLILENTSTGQHIVWILENGIYASTIALPTIPNQWHVSGIAGPAGNSRKNVVLENTVTGQHIVWVLDNGAYSFTVALPTVGPQWHITGVADAPTDNQAHVILENTITGHHVLWILTNGFYSFTLALPAVSPQWRVAAVADFLGNDQADIVLENTVTGHHVLWILNNGAYSSTIVLPTVGTQWKVAGAADFLGNGQAGIALQNTITGQRVTWILINGGYSYTTILPTLSPQWNIVEH
jgi:PQQ-like domain